MNKHVNLESILQVLENLKENFPQDDWDKGWNMALMDAIDTISNLEIVEELTDDEIVVLKNVDIAFKWLVRDIDGYLFLSKGKPTKNKDYWAGYSWVETFRAYNHLFKFVSWNDAEPYNIDELLALNGAKRG